MEIIKEVLRPWQLPWSDKFLSADGLAVAALLCNALAKFYCPSFYDYKPDLIRAAAERHNHVWKERDEWGDMVIYFETVVGQLSFHIFPEEDEDEFFGLLPDSNGRTWAGGWMQDQARGLALAFLNEDDGYLEYQLERFLATAQGY